MVGIKTESHGILPDVRDAVAVGFHQRRASLDGAKTAVAQPGIGRAGNYIAGRAEGHHLADDQRVQWIGREGARVGNVDPVGVRGGHRGNGVGDRRPGRSRNRVAGGGGRNTVQSAVAAAVQQIADGIHRLAAVELEEIILRGGAGRTGDKVIIDDVVAEIAGGVRRGVAGGVIIDHVIDINGAGLGEGLAVVRIDPEIAHKTRIGPLNMRAELLVDRIGNDAVLHGEIAGAHGIEAIPLAELDRRMIKNHVVGLAAVGADINATGTGAAAALAHAQAATDDIVLIVERQFIAHQSNPAAGRRLAGDGQIAGGGDRRAQIDVPAHVKNHNPVASADGRAESARTAIIGQRGHMIHRAPAPTGGIGAKTKRARKRHHRPVNHRVGMSARGHHQIKLAMGDEQRWRGIGDERIGSDGNGRGHRSGDGPRPIGVGRDELVSPQRKGRAKVGNLEDAGGRQG